MKRNRILVHIEYIISFVILPIIVIISELIRLYGESLIWSSIKSSFKLQLRMYKKFIRTKNKS